MVTTPPPETCTRQPLAGDSSAVLPAQTLPGSLVVAGTLMGDEVVLLWLKPSIWFIFFHSVRFCALTLIIGYFVALLAERMNLVANDQVLTGLGLVMLARLIWALLVWTGHTYLLTDRRIITIRGLSRVEIKQIPLRKIQRMELIRPWVQRILGLGTIGFICHEPIANPDDTPIPTPTPPPAAQLPAPYATEWLLLRHSADIHRHVAEAIRKAHSRGE